MCPKTVNEYLVPHLLVRARTWENSGYSHAHAQLSLQGNMADELKVWCTEELSKITDCAQEITDYILSISDLNDVEEYLSGILDPEDRNHQEFIQKFLKGLRKTTRSFGSLSSEVKKSPPAERESLKYKAKEDELKKKSMRFVPLYSSEGQAKASVRLPGRHPCECLGQKHMLVNNCVQCGRIVCEQEGSGLCYFCGSLVCTKEEQEILARNSKKSMKLYEKLVAQSFEKNGPEPQLKGRAESKQDMGLQRALVHKEKLLEYDRTSVRRTKVIDDECDYFASDGNRWLSKKEREALKKKENELSQKRHASRRELKVTLDFAGRKVIDENAGNDMYKNEEEAVLASGFYSSKGKPKKTGMVDPRVYSGIDLKFLPTWAVTSKPNLANSTQGSKPSSQVMRIQDKELQEMSDEGMCLSMHQPWASLLVMGIKKAEGRTWYTAHRGRLWIAAAAKAPTEEETAAIEGFYQQSYDGYVEFPKEYPTSCLLGCVELVGCLAQEEYREKYPDGESQSPFVFVCENPQQLVVKFPIKGKHKIWKIESLVHKAARRGLRGTL